MRPTILTGLLDIGRGTMDRDFAYYRRSFQRLAQIENPMVVYASARDADWIREVREDRPTSVRLFEPEDLRTTPHFAAIDRIRSSPDWVTIADWLKDSPQYTLPEYVPLIMMKPYWMQDVARENPFGTDRLYWLDAGIFSNKIYGHMGRWVDADILPSRSFLLFTVAFQPEFEANGMPLGPFCELLRVSKLKWWVRGGVLGGPCDLIDPFVERFDAVLSQTLEQGLLGTEENILTIMAHQEPARFNIQRLRFNRWSLGVVVQACLAGRPLAI